MLFGGVATWSLSAGAQQSQEKVRRLAIIAVVDDPWSRDILLAELKRRGLVQGRNLDVVVRTGTCVQMPQLVRELLAAKPDVIVAISDWAVRPAKQATDIVPIVASPVGRSAPLKIRVFGPPHGGAAVIVHSEASRSA